MIPLLIIRQKAYKSRRDCHWNHTVRTLENHITLLFFLSGYTVWLRHFIFTCYCSSICPASPNSVIWGRENARGVREQLCVSWFSSSALFWGRVFHSGSWSPEASLWPRFPSPASTLQRRAGVQMHSTAAGFHVGQEGWTQAAGFS